ncbi:MAG: sugar transferase [Candidatus Omnitrophica bacterium]|nr:sugar transferase [Candidatus Omnitrophota bacterium]MBU2251257.1 sugar transferase [Candidatus Omnitrophota bacterium]
MSKKSLCIVVTHSISLNFYRGQFEFFIKHGFDITVVCDPRGGMQPTAKKAGCKVVSLHMDRPLALVSDLISFARLNLFFFRNRFDLVEVSTPKASLLAGMAAWISCQPVIIYTHRGVYYETQAPGRKKLFSLLDFLLCNLVSQVRCVSKGVKDYLFRQFHIPSDKIVCLLEGSDNGIDLSQWTLVSDLEKQGELIRQKLKIPKKDVVIGYSGRLVKDKGICELVSAFESFSERYRAHLLLVGCYEQQDFVPESIRVRIKDNPNIHFVGWQDNPVPYFVAMNIFALPSYREGFNNTIIQASAMQLPVVTTDVFGAREAVLDGVTGLVIPKRNEKALIVVLEKLINDSAFREKLGKAGRKHVEQLFDSHKIWAAIKDNYEGLILNRRLKQKRIFDFVGACFGLVIFFPILIVFSLLILIFMGRPIFFRQQRLGYKQRPFVLYKFRTMRTTYDSCSKLLPDEQRLTWLGKIIRRTGLDEIIGFFNVLKGDMSLVGPRPLLIEYLERYSPEQRRRHDMLPGITGWALIHGRNAISWEEKFKYDLWYVDNWSLRLDLKILLITIWKILKGEGLTQKGHATMEEFKGTGG